MPILAPGVEPFEIQPPITSSPKDGHPTNRLLLDAQRVFHLIQDERHLTAGDLLQSVEERLAAVDGKYRNRRDREKARLEVAQVKELLTSRTALIEKLKNRCRLFRKARKNLNENAEWTLASEHFGVKTYYRREADNSLSVKLEGVIEDAPLFEQICVLKEFSLHSKWAPFCFSSQTIADLDKLDTVGWFLLGLQNFGLARDGVIHAIGCDNTLEDGSVILAGQGVCDVKPGMPEHQDGFLSNDPIIKQLDIPSVSKRRGTGRMTIRTFDAIIQVLSPTSANTRVVANVDPNISFLPASLLEFIMKHLAGVVLSKMQQAAKKITKNPSGNPHARLMRQEREFYEKWLLLKCKRLCESKGWEMTPVPYFSIDQSAEDMEQRPVYLPHMHSDNQVISQTSSPPRETESGRKRAGSVDDISEISNDSSLRSLLSRNPISQYLKREAQRTEQRKASQIQESRQRYAARLAPKESMEGLNNSSLDRLRRIKHKRSVDQSRNCDVKGDATNKFFDHLRGHSSITRVVVLFSLLSFLFQALHPEHIIHSFSLSINPSAPWHTIILLEFGSVLYLLFCTILHYLVCGVALVYAFDTLEVGSKAGKGVRDFYSQSVTKAVLICSLGIVGLSMVLSMVTFRASIPWFLVKVVNWSGQQMNMALHTAKTGFPQVLVDTLTTSTTVFGLVLSILASWVDSLSGFFVGGHGMVFSLTKPWINVLGAVGHAGNNFDWKEAAVAWGDETFALVQKLFTYSAVFLVVVVTMFHRYTGKGTRVKDAFDGLFQPQLRV